ncbi:hypothetical protein R6Q57_004860 [Mikania cordata]
MGFVLESNHGGSKLGFRSLVRRKRVDSIHSKSSDAGHHQLAKELSILHLIAIGVGSTIGAGVYILVGTVAREHSGPALAISFLIAGIAAALSAFCYAELASRCPSAGSAYHYSYICVGVGLAWIIGWALILEYTIGGSADARGISPNLALLFGGPDSLPAFLARRTVLGIVVDPCAAVLVISVYRAIMCGNQRAGGYLGFKNGWVGYKLSDGYFPFGVDGMLAGASTVFFSYIGFDSVASTAEEVKNPQRDLPLGIGAALSICCMLYMLVSAVIVGLVPYYAMDPDTPISSAFASHGIQWAAYIITIGAVTALCSTLMGSLLPQPRILMAMARDGLLPSFFSEVNTRTQVPVKSTILTGLIAATLAFSMDVEQLAGMVSVGTLLAFTMVAISVLILRYVPPDEVPLPSSLQTAIDLVFLRYSNIVSSQEPDVEVSKDHTGVSGEKNKLLLQKGELSVKYPLIAKVTAQAIFNEKKRREIAGWMIMLTCVGSLILTYSASNIGIPSVFRLPLCGIGGFMLLFSLAVLTSIEQDDARHNFGHTGWADTWMRVSVWLLIGVFVYGFYGRTHSSLQHAVYVPASHVDEIYQSSAESLHF